MSSSAATINLDESVRYGGPESQIPAQRYGVTVTNEPVTPEKPATPTPERPEKPATPTEKPSKPVTPTPEKPKTPVTPPVVQG